MRVIGLTGSSGSGKTTLLVGMVRALTARGLAVSTVKHAHHGFDLDRRGKDSFRHREAGAREVMLAGGSRWALLHEHRDGVPDLAELLARMAPADLLLVEGFRDAAHPKIEVFRPAHGVPPYWPGRPDIVAVACDAALPDCPLPCLDLNDVEAVVAWTLHFLGTDARMPQSP